MLKELKMEMNIMGEKIRGEKIKYGRGKGIKIEEIVKKMDSMGVGEIKIVVLM